MESHNNKEMINSSESEFAPKLKWKCVTILAEANAQKWQTVETTHFNRMTSITHADKK